MKGFFRILSIPAVKYSILAILVAGVGVLLYWNYGMISENVAAQEHIQQRETAVIEQQKAIKEIARVRDLFWKEVRIPGDADTLNIELEKALRLLDFIEIGELMARDALNREESCGGHFREEHQTEEGEAKRDDENFSYVACWKYAGEGEEPELLKEDLNYQYIKVQQRNYKN
jgi:succinate dehydrogenase/fumarate reductase flavoprotein subunit